jgi:hypothetical protein
VLGGITRGDETRAEQKHLPETTKQEFEKSPEYMIFVEDEGLTLTFNH